MIFGFALLFRFYFVFFRGISVDESSFWNYVQKPFWGSVFWPNYPPLFVFCFKWLYLMGVDSFQAARGIIFCLSSLNFYLLYTEIKKKKDSVPALIFWSICPASLVALGFGPAVFLEFFSIISWIALKYNKRTLLLISLLGLLLTSYTSCIYIVFLLIWFTFGKSTLPEKKYFTLLLIGFGFLGLTAIFFIRWNTLTWMKAGTLGESIIASFEFVRNLIGYSWIALFAYVYMLICSKNRNLFFTFFIIVALMFFVNLSTGMAAKEPRFVLFFIPWLIAGFYEISLKRRSMSILFLCAVFYHFSWFVYAKKSGLEAVDKQQLSYKVQEENSDLGKGDLKFNSSSFGSSN